MIAAEKHAKYNFTLPQSAIDGMDRIAAELSEPGREMSRSGVIRYLVADYLRRRAGASPPKSRGAAR